MSRLNNDFNINKWVIWYSTALFTSVIVISVVMFFLLGKNDPALSNYEVIRDYAFDLTKMLGIITLIVAVYHLGLNRKKLNFDVIESCIRRFNQIMLEINEAKKANDRKLLFNSLHSYVELVNEELFYMANEYIPAEVSKEWIDGIIDFLPLLNSKDEIVNLKYISYAKEFLKIIKAQPRIYYSFRYNGEVAAVYSEDPKVRVHARRKAVKAILNNLKKFNYY